MLTLIQSQTLGAPAASVTFSSIPQTYKTLKLVVSARGDQAVVNTNVVIAPNGLTTNLSYRSLIGNGSAASSTSGSTGLIGDADAASATASTFGNLELVIPNYAGSTNKAMSVDSVVENNATAGYCELFASLWASTAAITSLTISPGSGNWVANSTFTLYGLA